MSPWPPGCSTVRPGPAWSGEAARRPGTATIRTGNATTISPMNSTRSRSTTRPSGLPGPERDPSRRWSWPWRIAPAWSRRHKPNRCTSTSTWWTRTPGLSRSAAACRNPCSARMHPATLICGSSLGLNRRPTPSRSPLRLRRESRSWILRRESRSWILRREKRSSTRWRSRSPSMRCRGISPTTPMNTSTTRRAWRSKNPTRQRPTPNRWQSHRGPATGNDASTRPPRPR